MDIRKKVSQMVIVAATTLMAVMTAEADERMLVSEERTDAQEVESQERAEGVELVFTPLSMVESRQRGIMEMLDMEYMQVVVKGVSGFSQCRFDVVSCMDGKQESISPKVPEEYDWIIWKPIFKEEREADSMVVDIFVKREGGDSLTIHLPKLGQKIKTLLPRQREENMEEQFIMMECYSDEPLDPQEEMAIGAYTSGLVKKIKTGDVSSYMQDLCGLRDKHVHPKEWCDHEGVGNYIYFTMRLQ